jgi:hypothetical protein
LEYIIDSGKWIPRSKAKKRFHFSDIQLTLAIAQRLLRCKQGVNPYNSKSFDLISLDDLNSNLAKIEQIKLPRRDRDRLW